MWGGARARERDSLCVCALVLLVKVGRYNLEMRCPRSRACFVLRAVTENVFVEEDVDEVCAWNATHVESFVYSRLIGYLHCYKIRWSYCPFRRHVDV